MTETQLRLALEPKGLPFVSNVKAIMKVKPFLRIALAILLPIPNH